MKKQKPKNWRCTPSKRSKVVSVGRQTSGFQGAAAGPHEFTQIELAPCGAAIVYQFWLVLAGDNGGWGRAKPIVPGCASELALRVSTLCNVVRSAAKTAIAKAVAKIANAVRWVFIIDPPASTNGGAFSVASSTCGALRPEWISQQAIEFLFANGIAFARALFDPYSV